MVYLKYELDVGGRLAQKETVNMSEIAIRAIGSI